MSGKVVRWFPEKGYGFIKGTDGKTYFLHIRNVKSGKIIDRDRTIEFDSIEQQKGLVAINVKL